MSAGPAPLVHLRVASVRGLLAALEVVCKDFDGAQGGDGLPPALPHHGGAAVVHQSMRCMAVTTLGVRHAVCLEVLNPSKSEESSGLRRGMQVWPMCTNTVCKERGAHAPSNILSLAEPMAQQWPVAQRTDSTLMQHSGQARTSTHIFTCTCNNT